MTPTPPAQQEYIITFPLDPDVTEESILKYIKYGFAYRDNRVVIRPHPPSPEASLRCNCEPKSKGNDSDPEMCKKCLPSYQREGCSCLDMHDAAIAAKAREDVLDELTDKLPNIERSYRGEQIDTYVETHELKDLINALRSTPQSREDY